MKLCVAELVVAARAPRLQPTRVDLRFEPAAGGEFGLDCVPVSSSSSLLIVRCASHFDAGSPRRRRTFLTCHPVLRMNVSDESFSSRSLP